MSTDVSDKQRFANMAAEYDQMAPYLLPQYDFLQEEMIRQTRVASLSQPRIVDLAQPSHGEGNRGRESALAGSPVRFSVRKRV